MNLCKLLSPLRGFSICGAFLLCGLTPAAMCYRRFAASPPRNCLERNETIVSRTMLSGGLLLAFNDIAAYGARLLFGIEIR